jgi:hypothetical protein
VSPAVVSLALRRAEASGDPRAILDAVEGALDSGVRELHEQAFAAFYVPWGGFWAMVEDETLADRAGVLDHRLAAALS